MAVLGSDPIGTDDTPLISNRFLYRLTGAIAMLALLTAGISVGGRWFGEKISLAGHTSSEEIVALQIGQDKVNLPANVLRFRDQRRSGIAERADLYLTWPELSGYRSELRSRFDNVEQASSLIFLQLSQSTMSRDMSGRLEPIYSKLFEGPTERGSYGLTLHHLSAEAGYGREVLLTASRPGESDYAVRCLLPDAGERPTSGDCQRDISIGQDLSVLYRFSSDLLKDWKHIDAAVRTFVESRLSVR
jgi:hypothetical protein